MRSPGNNHVRSDEWSEATHNTENEMKRGNRGKPRAYMKPNAFGFLKIPNLRMFYISIPSFTTCITYTLFEFLWNSTFYGRTASFITDDFMSLRIDDEHKSKSDPFSHGVRETQTM